MLTTLDHFDEDFFDSDEVSKFALSCFAALEKKNNAWWQAMSRALFLRTSAEIEDVIKLIKKTNKCTSQYLPTSVWIDEEGNWTIDVFPRDEEYDD